MPGHLGHELVRTSADARSRLWRLEAERLEAVDAGLDRNARYMGSLRHDIEASRAVYIGLAVTEIATLRAQLGGPQIG